MSPIQVIGEDQNEALTAGILGMAQETSRKGISQARSQQYIEGKARVASGEGLKEMKANQGLLDKIFGNATIQGAEAQTVIQAADKFSLYLNSNMEKFKNIPTEEFASQQGKYITDNLLTGDPTADQYITLAASEVITKASAVHAKHHELYKQESSRLQFETTLDGATQVLNQAFNDPSQSTLDKLDALNTAMSRVSILPGQTAEAHRKSVASVLVNALKNDRPELYNGIILGYAEVDGTRVPITHDILFDSDTRQVIEDAYSKYQDRTDTTNKFNKGMAIAELQTASLDLNVGDTQLGLMIQETLKKHGADLLSDNEIASMFTNREKVRKENTKQTRGIQQIADNTAMSNPDRAQVAEDLGLYEQTLLQQVQRDSVNMPEKDAAARLENAQAVILQKSVMQKVVPPTWKAKWNTGFANLLALDGSKKANPVFVETMRDFNNKFNSPLEGAKELYLSSLDPAQLANMEGVKLYMSTGMEIEDAIRHQASNVIPIKEAVELSNSKEYNKRIDSFVSNPDPGFWKSVFGSDWDGVDKNSAEMRDGIKHHIVAQVASTGDTGEGSWKAAIHQWKKTHEPVKGKAVNNYGIPLNRKAGLRDPSVKFEKVVDYYLNTRGGENAIAGEQKFGLGFNPENADIKVDNEYVTITPKDAEGLPISGTEGIPRKISIAAMGKIYNTEVTDRGLVDKLQGKSLSAIGKLLKSTGLGGGTLASSAYVLNELGVGKPKTTSPEYKAALLKEEALINDLKAKVKSNVGITPGAVGEVAVKHSVSEVERVLGSTNGFLERVAKVESHNGTHKDTFNGVSNGIWQVDDIGLADTKIPSPTMNAAYEKIKSAFGIDWMQVKASDLQKPLYGALAARLFLLRRGTEIPSTLEEQAVYWKKYYNRTGKGTPESFLSKFK